MIRLPAREGRWCRACAIASPERRWRAAAAVVIAGLAGWGVSAVCRNGAMIALLSTRAQAAAEGVMPGGHRERVGYSPEARAQARGMAHRARRTRHCRQPTADLCARKPHSFPSKQIDVMWSRGDDEPSWPAFVRATGWASAEVAADGRVGA